MDLTGQILGRYRLIGKVAKGGMADVYKARQESLDRIVALKILPSALRQDDTFQARFEREARAVARLHHPNILTVHDYGEEDGLTYIAMQYTSGGTLRERMHRPLSLSEAVEIACRVGDALDYAHRHGVIHRDVKPSNILLTEEGWPLLSDFGLVKVTQESTGITRPSASMGTPEYMSPEQGQGRPVDHRTDIYALGAVFYEMVTGRLPYSADSPVGLILKHTTESLSPPSLHCPDLPAGIETVILKAMAKAPEDRYASAGEMVQALQEAWLQAQPETPALRAGARTSHPTPFGQVRTVRTARRTRWKVIWLALLVPVLLAGAIRLGWTFVPRLVPPNVQAGTSTTPAPTRVALATPTFTALPRPTQPPSPTWPSTVTPTTTATATLTSPPSPTPTATSTWTPTPEPPRAMARMSASLFEGPSAQTEELAIVSPGETVDIQGRADEWEYGKWLYVHTAEGAEGFVHEPRFEYTAAWTTLPVIEVDRSGLALVSTPVTDRAVNLVVTPGSLKIEHVWSSSVCHANGSWTALFLVKLSGGDGETYTLYWDAEPIPYEVKVDERDVAVIQRPGDIGLLVGTIRVESGGQRVSKAADARKSCGSK